MSIQAFLIETIQFVNATVIPFIIAIAFLIFLYNLARYFFWHRDAEEKRDEAKRNALWGILAFVVIVSIWGVVNFLVTDLGIGQDAAPCPDYNPNCTTTGNSNNQEIGQCVGGIICTLDNQGRRTCFAC